MTNRQFRFYVLAWAMILLLLAMVARPVKADGVYGVVAIKVTLPCHQEWNYHSGGFWDWWPEEYLILIDSGEVTEKGDTIYDAVSLSQADYDAIKVGCYWPYCCGN